MGLVLTDFKGTLPGVANYDLPNNAASEAFDCEFGGTVRAARFFDIKKSTYINPSAEIAVRSMYAAVGRLGVGTHNSSIDPATYTSSLEQFCTLSSYTASNINNFFNSFFAGVTHEQLVTSAYNSVERYGFGTTPDTIDRGGYNYWLNKLSSGVLTHRTFIKTFYSGHGFAQLIHSAYNSIGRAGAVESLETIPVAEMVMLAYNSIGRFGFGTTPETIDQAGYDYWVNMVHTEKLSYTDFLSSFYSTVRSFTSLPVSMAYINRIGANLVPADIDFSVLVEKAYNSIGRFGFGTTPETIDQAGYDCWVNELESGALNRASFLRAFYGSSNFPYFTSEAYGAIRHRLAIDVTPTTVDQEGFDYWMREMASGRVTPQNFLHVFYSRAKELGKFVHPDLLAYAADRSTHTEAITDDFVNYLATSMSYHSVNGEASWPCRVYSEWWNSTKPNGIIPSPMADDAADRVYTARNGRLMRSALRGDSRIWVEAGVEAPSGALTVSVSQPMTKTLPTGTTEEPLGQLFDWQFRLVYMAKHNGNTYYSKPFDGYVTGYANSQIVFEHQANFQDSINPTQAPSKENKR